MPGFLDLWFIVAVVALIAAGGFAFALYRKGVPKGEIPGQVALRAGDMADSLRDEILSALRTWAVTAPAASLKDAYYDKENFDRDCGRVLAAGGSPKMVRLDGAVKLDGDEPAINYYTQPNGNVTTKAPA